MAKNKLLRYARIIVGGYNLSGDARVVDNLLNNMGEAEMTGWDESVKNYLADKVRNVGIRGFQAILNDATGRGFDVLKNPGDEVLSFLFGSGGDPDFGDPAYLMSAIQMMDNASFDGAKGIITADFLPKQGLGINPIGRVLHPITLINATTTGDSVDDLAASSDGWRANLHILTTASGDYAFKIQDSANGSDWADLTDGAFTLDGSAVGSESISGTGEIRQYARFVATKTAGSCTPVCTLSRE